jgi:DNA-binding NarL/FixJ family response regulator
MPPSLFISSTFSDLERHRSLVRDAVARLEFGSKAMELFGALPNTPKEECLRLVRSAQAYVGIFAMRYGHIDAATGKSLTQLEYEEAQTVRLPTLVYLMNEDLHPVLPKHVETGPSAEKLSTFKAKLKQAHVVSFFSSPEDLAAKVTQDVVRLLGGAKTQAGDVIAQLARNATRRHPLTQPRFEFLKAKVAGIYSQDVPDSILKEALELVIGGDNMAAAFVVSRGAPMPLDDAVDGLMSVERVILDILQRTESRSVDGDA